MKGGARWAPLLRGALVVVGVLPIAMALVRDLPGLGRVAAAADLWFAFQCERDGARSMALFGAPLPVCTRCLGIYLGLGSGALVLRPRLTPLQLRVWVAVAAVAMTLDVATELLGMRPPLSPLRLATGFGLAYPVGAALVRALSARTTRT